MLSGSQLRVFAEILYNIGLIFFASLVVPFFIGSGLLLDHLLSGILLSGWFWILSLLAAKYSV